MHDAHGTDPVTFERRRRRRMMSAVGVLIACGLQIALGSVFALAGPPNTNGAPNTSNDQNGNTETNADNNGSDLTRPQDSFDVRFRTQTSSGTTSRSDQDSLILRSTTKINLDADWTVSALAQVPVIAKTTTMVDSSGSDREFGIGDATFQTVIARKLSERWAVGFGVRFVAPTAQDNLGGGQWQAMPGFGVRYSLPEIGPNSYFVPAIRYAMSFAGDASKRNISEPQIAPTLNVGLPDHWFVTFYPSNDIRINFGDPVSGQTGRLFLPFDVAVGRKLSDRLLMSLEVSVPIVKDYPVYNFKSELRFVVQY
jgi:hypothetical protein